MSTYEYNGDVIIYNHIASYKWHKVINAKNKNDAKAILINTYREEKGLSDVVDIGLPSRIVKVV